MSNNWNVFQSQHSDGLGRRTSLSEYCALAEANRHIHFAEGVTELENRVAGDPVNPDLNPQVIFADFVQKFAAKLRASHPMDDQAFQLLKQYTQLVWCCCFAGREACDDVADLLEQDMGWKARAEFIVVLAQVRDALGSEHVTAPFDATRDLESLAQARLRDRWLKEAVAVSFADPAYTGRCAQTAWISQLDRDSLHDFVLNSDVSSEPVFVLKAAAENRECDHATATTLYSRCQQEMGASRQRGRNKRLAKVVDALHQRILAGDFATSDLRPGEEQQTSHQEPTRKANTASSRPAAAVAEPGSKRHSPVYAYHADSRTFLTPFSDWSAIRIVA